MIGSLGTFIENRLKACNLMPLKTLSARSSSVVYRKNPHGEGNKFARVQVVRGSTAVVQEEVSAAKLLLEARELRRKYCSCLRSGASVVEAAAANGGASAAAAAAASASAAAAAKKAMYGYPKKAAPIYMFQFGSDGLMQMMRANDSGTL